MQSGWSQPPTICSNSELRAHPTAIVTGRVRYKTGKYRPLSQLVGTGQVGQQFGEA